MRFLTAEQMKQEELSSGKSVVKLMASAGKAIADEAAKRGSCVFVCGSGNNGGDGYAAALLLSDARLYPATAPHSPAAKHYAAKFPPERITHSIEGFDCIVDCLLGTGIRGEPREPIKSIINEINNSGAFVLSADVPSGLGTPTEVQADLTISLQHPKAGMEQKRFVVKPIWQQLF